MKQAIIAAIATFALSGPALPQTYASPEQYDVEVSMQYEVSGQSNIAAATQLGLPLNGDINFLLTFVRPDCLVYKSGDSRTYVATAMQLKAFDRSANTNARAEAWMIVSNDENGFDRLQFTLFPSRFRARGEIISTLIFRTFNLPDDAVQSTDFVSDAALIEDILQYPQLQAIVQLASGGGSPEFFMETRDVNVSVASFAGPGNASVVSTCTPPAP